MLYLDEGWGTGPKPDKLMRDALALELHQEVKLTSGEKVKKLRLVARTLVDNAIDGDTTAARECFDRMDGKVPQSADATKARGDITVTWVRPASCRSCSLRREQRVEQQPKAKPLSDDGLLTPEEEEELPAI